MMGLFNFAQLFLGLFLTTTRCQGLTIQPCGTSSSTMATEGAKDFLLVCDDLDLSPGSTVIWTLLEDYPQATPITIANCTHDVSSWNCGRSYNVMIHAYVNEHTKRSHVILPDVHRLRFPDGKWTCQNGGLTSECWLDVVHPSNNTKCYVIIDKNKETATGRCTTSQMYSSIGRYSCQWFELNENNEEIEIESQLNLTNCNVSSREYRCGTCSFSKDVSASRDIHLYRVLILPGNLSPSVSIIVVDNKMTSCPSPPADVTIKVTTKVTSEGSELVSMTSPSKLEATETSVNDGGTIPDTNSDSNKGIIIAMAVVLPVLLICILVLLICLWRRRKNDQIKHKHMREELPNGVANESYSIGSLSINSHGNSGQSSTAHSFQPSDGQNGPTSGQSTVGQRIHPPNDSNGPLAPGQSTVGQRIHPQNYRNGPLPPGQCTVGQRIHPPNDRTGPLPPGQCTVGQRIHPPNDRTGPLPPGQSTVGQRIHPPNDRNGSTNGQNSISQNGHPPNGQNGLDQSFIYLHPCSENHVASLNAERSHGDGESEYASIANSDSSGYDIPRGIRMESLETGENTHKKEIISGRTLPTPPGIRNESLETDENTDKKKIISGRTLPTPPGTSTNNSKDGSLKSGKDDVNVSGSGLKGNDQNGLTVENPSAVSQGFQMAEKNNGDGSGSGRTDLSHLRVDNISGKSSVDQLPPLPEPAFTNATEQGSLPGNHEKDTNEAPCGLPLYVDCASGEKKVGGADNQSLNFLDSGFQEKGADYIYMRNQDIALSDPL